MIKKVEFTEKMRREYTILLPNMLPLHFRILSSVFNAYGYKTVLLTNKGPGVIERGLQYVHNDACYPVQCVAGQFLDALLSGEYDTHKCAVMITQTGGGCRASNYVAMLRKAFARAGMEYIPVISLNFSGLEKNSGFHMPVSMLYRLLMGLLMADMLMLLREQTRPYEKNRGEAEALADQWVLKICQMVRARVPLTYLRVHRVYGEMARSFEALPRTGEKKPRVGIVGEIYVKFSALGNNALEDFLVSEGAETVTPGLVHFGLYCLENARLDAKLYHKGSILKRALCALGVWAGEWLIRDTARAAVKHGFHEPMPFKGARERLDGIMGEGMKMGEGWLLPAEILELIHAGINNVVCVQPFGCLPNHIVGKGVMKPIQERHPDANIVAIDYDPGMTKVNQENRLRLMLANAK